MTAQLARTTTSHTTAPPDTPADSLRSPGIAVLLLCAFLSIVDFFVVNVALPTIGGDLNASASMLELVVAGYGTAYAALLVVGGRLGDAVGRRRMITIGVAGFTAASALCGLAPSAGWLVAARVLQGGFGALMVPQVLATFQSALEGTRRTRALGLWGAVAGAGTVVGQAAGGLLVAADIGGSSWRPIFLVNVPLGLLALVVIPRVVPETRSDRPLGVDVIGTVLFAAALVAALVPLSEGRTLGWPVWTWVLLAASVVLAVVLARVERRVERSGATPLLPPALLRLPSMRRGIALAVPFFMGFGSFMFAFAITVQTGLHEGALVGGLAIVPLGAVYLIASLFAARAIDRFGRSVLGAGSAVTTVGIVLTAIPFVTQWPDVSLWAVAPGLAVTGLGQAFMFASLFRLVLSEVPRHFAGAGSGVLITVQQASLALGVAVLGTVFLGIAGDGTAHLGTAFAILLAIDAVIAALLAVAARTLPRGT